eukprot:2585622-Pyramimonas_sp.AAC.1
MPEKLSSVPGSGDRHLCATVKLLRNAVVISSKPFELLIIKSICECVASVLSTVETDSKASRTAAS